MKDTYRPLRRRTLTVESLESMTLLSGLVPIVGPAATAISQAPAAPTALNMTARGFFAFSRSNPDAGTTYFFFATTRIPGIGFTTVTGSITTPGFIMNGHATGTLQVHSPNGALTLSVTGPTQAGFSKLPTQLAFTVTSASGQLGSISGSGTLSLALNQFGFRSPFTGSGTVVMTFREPKPMA
jgi:hypothetical protein